MLIVVGLGGNALLRRNDQTDWATQRCRADRAGESVAPLASHGALVVTHGNGPQVGLLALEQRAARHDGGDPLDALDALTEGSIGYLLCQSLANALPGREVATLLTQVVVDPSDPAFFAPTKPIGIAYSEAQMGALGREHGWAFHQTPAGWRRVVPSPEPQSIVEVAAIRLLLAGGQVVVCGGGGGIPVLREPTGRLRGTEAVIDKDLTTARLAVELGADTLVLLTDVDSVMTDFGTPHSRRIHKIAAAEARRLALPSGSMGTKVEAACRFVEATGHVAGIGALDQAADVLLGAAGTIVSAGAVNTRYWDPVT